MNFNAWRWTSFFTFLFGSFQAQDLIFTRFWPKLTNSVTLLRRHLFSRIVFTGLGRWFRPLLFLHSMVSLIWEICCMLCNYFQRSYINLQKLAILQATKRSTIHWLKDILLYLLNGLWEIFRIHKLGSWPDWPLQGPRQLCLWWAISLDWETDMVKIFYSMLLMVTLCMLTSIACLIKEKTWRFQKWYHSGTVSKRMSWEESKIVVNTCRYLPYLIIFAKRRV